MAPPPPVLLANADYYGTLAATRSLGLAGVPVYLADPHVLAVSRWSRHATRAMRCPPIASPLAFLDWLTALGEREPGLVLYPTSDDTAFLYALRTEELSRTYRTYQPGLDALLHVLDKQRLYTTAREVGMQVPDTWFPQDDGDVARLAHEVPLPLLVKPRTQVLSRIHSKGLIVREPGELLPRYREFVRSEHYDPLVIAHMPDAGKPMLQRFYPAAASEIYVLSAFLSPSAKHFAARTAMKVFQRPRTLGVGLCFEDAPVHHELADAARRLAVACGYWGLYQLEFIKAGDDYLLIDFNPRFYNQLAYDVARGFPLPSIVYAAAMGQEDRMASLVRGARVQPESSGMVFCSGFGLKMMVSAQRLAGSMSAGEAARWRLWHARYAAEAVDPAVSVEDPLPGFVDKVAQLASYARHPRAFLRKVVLDRTTV